MLITEYRAYKNKKCCVDWSILRSIFCLVTGDLSKQQQILKYLLKPVRGKLFGAHLEPLRKKKWGHLERRKNNNKRLARLQPTLPHRAPTKNTLGSQTPHALKYTLANSKRKLIDCYVLPINVYGFKTPPTPVFGEIVIRGSF